MSDVYLIESNIRSIENSLRIATQQLEQARNEGNAQRIAELEAYIEELNISLVDARLRLQRAQQDDLSTRVSAGSVVDAGATARDDGAYTINPPQAAVIIVPESRINIATEVGTNAPVRPLTQTQATPPLSINQNLPGQALGSENNQADAVVNPAAQNTGAVSRGDDATPTTTQGAQQVINAAFSTPQNARIVSQPNVLNQYASYTYAITWYLLTPAQYNTMQTTGRKDCSTWQLLMQSGGAPTQATGTYAGRNQYFSLDYYIDDLEIDSLVPLKGANMAHSAVDLRFKVTEPNGLTLINNLYRAVNDLYKSPQNNQGTTVTTQTPNYVMAQYCLAVRFYGYDDNGNLAQVKGTGGALSDPAAIVEKFYPFVITNIRFRMANRAVEYEVQGKPMGQFYNLSQDRGTIPFQFQLIGETVGDILSGKPVGTVYSVPDDGRQDSPQPQTSGGLSPAPDQAQTILEGNSDSPFQVGA